MIRKIMENVVTTAKTILSHFICVTWKYMYYYLSQDVCREPCCMGLSALHCIYGRVINFLLKYINKYHNYSAALQICVILIIFHC